MTDLASHTPPSSRLEEFRPAVAGDWAARVDDTREPSRADAPGLDLVSSVAGTAGGVGAETTLAAHRVLRVVHEIRPVRAKQLAIDAARVLKDHGPSGRDGAFGQVSGKVFERLDATAHNLRQGRGGILRLAKDPQARIDGQVLGLNGRVMKYVSHKKSAGGVARASDPGPGVVFRVPRDQASAARASGSVTVEGSKVTTGSVNRTTEKGLRALADRGARAGSLARAAGRASLVGAVTTPAIGGAIDYLTAVRTGSMTWNRFAAERVGDVGEGAVVGVGGWAGAMGAAAVVATTTAATGTVVPIAAPLVAAVACGWAAGRALQPLRRRVSDAVHDRLEIRSHSCDAPTAMAA